MPVYGIDYYAGARFGVDPSLIRPDFSVAPFKSLAQDYATLLLTWRRPPSTACTQLQLVRNRHNLPQDETDGFLLFPTGWNITQTTPPPVMPALGSLTQYQSVAQAMSYLDITATPGFNYYSMFGWDSINSLWIRCTDLISVLPIQWGHAYMLYQHLPAMYRDNDFVLVEPYDPWAHYRFTEDTIPPLQRYTNLLGFQLDFIRTEIESLLAINDAEAISGALLPLFGYQLGMVTEPEIGMQQERQLVENAIHLYKLKGSSRGITEWSAILTSYPTMLVHKGYNLLLCRDDSVFETSIGTWQAWPPAGTHFPPGSGTNNGLQLSVVPNLLNIPNMTNPLAIIGFEPSQMAPPYNNTGLSVSVTGASTADITTGGIPTLDFLSSTDAPGNITWEIQIWSSAQRTVEVSVWGDDGSGVPIQVAAPQTFTSTLRDWVRFHVTAPVTFGLTLNTTSNGTASQSFALTGPYNGAHETVQVNGVTWQRAPGNSFAGQSSTAQVYVVSGTTVQFGNGVNGAIPPKGAAVVINYGHYDYLYPRVRILNMAAGEYQYLTLLCAWACLPAQVGVYTPVYDYPRDLKVVLEPQSSNLLANPLTTFANGLDGWGCTSNDPLNIDNVVGPQQWSFEDGSTAGFVPGTNTLITNSTQYADDGTHSLAMRAVAAGDISAVSPIGQAGYRLWWGPGDAGSTQYPIRAAFRAGTTGRACSLFVTWYDANGVLIGSSNVSGNDNATGFTYVTGTVTAPPGTVYLGQITPYVTACAAGEIHYVDDIWVQGLPVWGRLRTRPADQAPVPHGTASLQLRVVSAPSTLWAGTVASFTGPPPQPAGWFVDPFYDWFGGNRLGVSSIVWFDPVTGWFVVSGGSYFGVADTWMGGNWFPKGVIPQTANLVGFQVFPGQWLDFSVYVQALVGHLWNAAMEIGFRWYFPDNTWTETSTTYMLTNTFDRYNVTAQAPYEPVSGTPASLVFGFCRFPQAMPDDIILLNSALLSTGASMPPFDDPTMHPGDPDYIIDSKGSSGYYRRRTPRTARLRAEMYRWIPMSSTYTLEFGSVMTQPPVDQTTWPP